MASSTLYLPSYAWLKNVSLVAMYMYVHTVSVFDTELHVVIMVATCETVSMQPLFSFFLCSNKP